MSVNVNDFKEYIDFIINKVQEGGSITPEQYNVIFDRAQMQVFERDRLVFLKTQESSDYLDWFLKTVTLSPNPTTGYLSYPSDFEHTAAVRSYYVRPSGGSVEITVEPVKNRDWGEIYSSQLQTPTRRFPKYTEFKDEYRFLPKNIGIVMLDYYKTPVKPVWGYTIVNNEPVYDSATSVNFEWASFAFSEVAGMCLSMVGINLKDAELSQFSSQYQQQNNSLL